MFPNYNYAFSTLLSTGLILASCGRDDQTPHDHEAKALDDTALLLDEPILTQRGSLTEWLIIYYRTPHVPAVLRQGLADTMCGPHQMRIPTGGELLRVFEQVKPDLQPEGCVWTASTLRGYPLILTYAAADDEVRLRDVNAWFRRCQVVCVKSH